MGMFESWGNTVKDLADKLFGNKPKVVSHGLNPGDRGYIQAVFGIPYDEKKYVPRKRQPATNCKRYDEVQRKQKLARKGHRMKKRQRQEGPYATS